MSGILGKYLSELIKVSPLVSEYDLNIEQIECAREEPLAILSRSLLFPHKHDMRVNGHSKTLQGSQ
jgi:hypothetical protein